ncbi:MAG: isoprenylcysteine carboxylmethyltransferase family protein [Pseudolabrys sp.]
MIAILVAQRLAELALARRNTGRLLRQGGIEYGAGHYPFMVAMHGLWLAALLAFGYDRPVEPVWFALFILLQAARVWIIASLGGRWTTRVIVLPGAAPVQRGPYRWVKHPNYLIVALEIAVVPLALGLPLIAIVFTLANAVILAVRINVENAALRTA